MLKHALRCIRNSLMNPFISCRGKLRKQLNSLVQSLSRHNYIVQHISTRLCPACQIPWQIVILDDGVSLLGTAHFDPNRKTHGVISSLNWTGCNHTLNSLRFLNCLGIKEQLNYFHHALVCGTIEQFIVMQCSVETRQIND